MSRVTRSITRRDTDPCPLAHLPPELLTVIFDHSSGTDLACWALTNAHWARVITPALATFWKTHASMCAALENATSFDELEAVDKMSASCTLKSVDESLSIDTFRLEDSFAKLQRKVAGATHYEYHWRTDLMKDVDASDADARLDFVKKLFSVQPHVIECSHRSSENKLAIATTLRLRPPELMEVAKSWLAVASDGADSPSEWLPCLVGAALEKNLHRSKIDNRKLAELLPMAIKMVGDDSPTTEAQAVDAVINWLPKERQRVLASLVRPVNEPENACFWFEFLFCDLSDECPMFSFGGYGVGVENLCQAIDAHVLAKLIEITVVEEEEEFRSIDMNGGWGGEGPASDEIHELTLNLLRGWVAAKNFPAEPLSPEEQTAFIGMLTSLNDDIKGLISREALNWVLACSRLPATARLICSALG